MCIVYALQVHVRVECACVHMCMYAKGEWVGRAEADSEIVTFSKRLVREAELTTTFIAPIVQQVQVRSTIVIIAIKQMHTCT